MPSRPVGRLLDLEYDILDGCALLAAENEDAYGFALARLLAERQGANLVGHGTLYKALGRLVAMGLLNAAWGEDPQAGRPRRRLYTLTGEGETARSGRPAKQQIRAVARTALA